MPQHLVDLLVQDYVTEHIVGDINHGLQKPRQDGFAVMKHLQKDLLHEQDEVHGGKCEEMGKKWASMSNDVAIEIDSLVQRIFDTADLYQEMSEADDEVTAERSNIYHSESALTHSDGKQYTEHFYSATVTYHINMKLHLEGRGVSEGIDEASKKLHGTTAQFYEYIRANGPLELLDRWLPGKHTYFEYGLNWEVKDVLYRPYGTLDVVLKVSERWLTDAE